MKEFIITVLAVILSVLGLAILTNPTLTCIEGIVYQDKGDYLQATSLKCIGKE